jgi:hypothetical protein
VDPEGALNLSKKGVCPCLFYCPDYCLVTALTAFNLLIEMSTTRSKKLIVTKVEQRNELNRFNDDGRKRTRHIFW